MKGSNNKITQDSRVSFQRKYPKPLDKYDNLSTISELATEIPKNIRYIGMLIFVEDEDDYYYFSSGVEDFNFIKLSSISNIITHSEIVNVIKNVPIVINHNLNTENVCVTFIQNGNLIISGWKLGDDIGLNTSNSINFTSDIELGNVTVFIIGRSLSDGSANIDFDFNKVKIDIVEIFKQITAINLKLGTTPTSKKGLQFSEPIELVKDTPKKFELDVNMYFNGFEITIGTPIVTVGTSNTTVDDMGELDHTDSSILEMGLNKVTEVWFQSNKNCTIEPIIFIK